MSNVLRLVLAVLWTASWGAARCARYSCSRKRWMRKRRHSLAFSWGRHDSPKAMRCTDCGWMGPLRWAVHTYKACGDEDVEPVDCCPRCDADALEPAFWRGKGVWAS